MRIEAREISVSIDGTPILADINLDVIPGKVLGLIGPNGAGKSTLLRVLAGLCRPQAGQLRYDGIDADHVPARERARRLSFLAQSATIEWPLPVSRLVALGRLPHRGLLGPLDPARDEQAVQRAMVATGVASFAERAVGTLSGGEKMRVMLARALAVEATTLLADEPVTALDAAHQLQTMRILRETAEQGASVVVVLHDLTLAGRFCDSLAVLDHGRLAALGAPEEVLTPNLLRDIYGVVPFISRHEEEIIVLPWR